MPLARSFAAALAPAIVAAALTLATPASADPVVGPHAPEPEAWTLMIIGSTLVGASMRLRRRFPL